MQLMQLGKKARKMINVYPFALHCLVWLPNATSRDRFCICHHLSRLIANCLARAISVLGQQDGRKIGGIAVAWAHWAAGMVRRGVGPWCGACPGLRRGAAEGRPGNVDCVECVKCSLPLGGGDHGLTAEHAPDA